MGKSRLDRLLRSGLLSPQERRCLSSAQRCLQKVLRTRTRVRRGLSSQEVAVGSMGLSRSTLNVSQKRLHRPPRQRLVLCSEKSTPTCLAQTSTVILYPSSRSHSRGIGQGPKPLLSPALRPESRVSRTV